LYHQVFPGWPRPSSAYLQHGIGETAEIIRQRHQTWLPEQIRESLRNHGLTPDETTHQLLTMDILRLVSVIPPVVPRYRRNPPTLTSSSQLASAVPLNHGTQENRSRSQSRPSLENQQNAELVLTHDSDGLQVSWTDPVAALDSSDFESWALAPTGDASFHSDPYWSAFDPAGNLGGPSDQPKDECVTTSE
jgi:hypothetical protein